MTNYDNLYSKTGDINDFNVLLVPRKEIIRLQEEITRLAGEVASRNLAAMEGRQASAALERVHAYYEAELLSIQAEFDRLKKEQNA